MSYYKKIFAKMLKKPQKNMLVPIPENSDLYCVIVYVVPYPAYMSDICVTKDPNIESILEDLINKSTAKEIINSFKKGEIHEYLEQMIYYTKCENELVPDNRIRISVFKGNSEIYWRTLVNREATYEKRGTKIYRIFHSYEKGDRSVYIESKFNPSDQIAYLIFKAEELFEDDVEVSNLAIANLLISLYGCKGGERRRSAIDLNLYQIRESRCGDWYLDMDQRVDLHKDSNKIKEYLSPYVDRSYENT